MADEDRLYCDRFYVAKHIYGLPRDIRCGDDVTQLTINYACQSEVTSSLSAMLKSASERGDNVGIDEFQGQYGGYLTKYSFIFTARWKGTDIWRTSPIAAFIIIGPSCFSRVTDPSLADIHVIRSRDLVDETYTELIKLSVELTKQLDVGYMDCVMSVAASCDSLVRVLTGQLQFRIVATLPRAVNMANGVGLTDSLILVYSIAPPEYQRQPRSEAEVLSMLTKHGYIDGVDSNIAYRKAVLPSLSFLPQQYLFNDYAKTMVTIRNMRRDEDKVLYDLINANAQRGEGFAFDFANLAFFRSELLLAGPCIVFEETSSGEVIGWSVVYTSPMTRSPQANCVDSIVLIAKQYQDRGFGREMIPILNAAIVQLGYTSGLFEFWSNNVRMQRVTSPYGTLCGIIPRAAYLAGCGWMDLKLSYVDFSSDEASQTFDQLIDDNRRKRGVKRDIANDKLVSKI